MLDRMLLALLDAELGVIGAAHEYGMSQWEINLTHSDALDAADRAFRFKAAVKDLATRDGLLATFMGKPFNGDAGSGFHLHLSLCGEGGANAFADTAGEEGCAELLRHFIAGVIAHAPGADGVPQPDGQRLPAHRPARARPDARVLGLRQPLRARSRATRARRRRRAWRCGWPTAAANPYLATAALLFAGLDGIQRELTPPAPVAGLVYELPEEEQGEPIPLTLDAALDALEADATLCDAMGRSSSTRSSRSSAPSSSAITATSPTGTSRSTPTTSSAPRRRDRGRQYPWASASEARTVLTSASVEKPSACAASVAACTS